MKRKLLRTILSAAALCTAFLASSQVTVTITTFTNCPCSGNANGTATAGASGGTAPYTYSWTPAPPTGQGTNSVSGLSPGVYTVTVHDYASNVGNQTVTITSPPPLTLTPTAVNTSCGLSNGSATMGVSGGTAPYVYSWHPVAGSLQTLSGLTAGMYSCFVTDNNGCTSMNSTTVNTGPAAPSITTTHTDVLCSGASTGSATVTTSGGTAPFAYTWTPGNYNGLTYSNIPAGMYTVNVTDANGCGGTYSVSVNQPTTPVSATLTESDVHCNGGADGSVTVTASGGVSGYTYSWAPYGGNGTSVLAVIANTFTCTVTDINGCTYSGVTTVHQPPALTLTPSVVNATCGNNNGSATITASGGTAPYVYSWSPGTCTTATFSPLTPGTYSCIVTDNNGCTSSNNVAVNGISVPTLNMSKVDASCKGASNGSASVSVTGGTTPYTYSWSPNGATTVNNTNIPAGNYTVTVTDASGCSMSNSITVSEPSTALSATTTGNNVHCNGGNDGNATVTATGGTPGYTYLWSPGGAVTVNVSSLNAGTYTCTITDANGCTYAATTTLTQPTAIVPASTFTNITCYGVCNGVVNASASGGTVPYTYSWNPGGGTSVTEAGQCTGTYTCFITDMNGCMTSTPAVTISEPAQIVNNVTLTNATCNGCDGAEASVVTGGTAPYTYLWSPGGQTTPTLSALCPGTYSVTVTDGNGCTQMGGGNITQSSSPQISGTVTAPVSGAINSGMAYLVQYDSVLRRQQVVDSIAISSGSYSFTNSGGKKYLVYALANHTTYPNVIKTYAGNADQWINATIISAPCASVQTANITMIELTPPAGSGSLSGHVQQAAGYSPRMRPGNPIVLAPGDPIPGLDVNLEQHPGGIIAQTSTDASSGAYHFGNVPPGVFEVFVDVPGLGMVSQYTRTITSNEMFPNLDYKVDSVHIYKDSVLVTSAPVIKTNTNSLWIAPNPSRDLLNITYTQPEAGEVVFELYSVIGEKVTAFTKSGAVSGTFQLHASDYGIPQGVYTLRMTAGNSVLIRRVVFIH